MDLTQNMNIIRKHLSCQSCENLLTILTTFFRKTYSWSDPNFPDQYSASFVPRTRNPDEETVIMPNVFDMRQPLPVSIKKHKIMKMWQVMLEPDDDEDQATEDARMAKLQEFMATLMPKEW